MPVYKDSQAKNKPWYFAFEIKDGNGKRKTIKQRGFATKKQATDKEAEARTEWTKGTYVTPSKMLYGDYVRDWLDNRRKLSVDSKYYYQNYLKNHIIPFLGHLSLSEINDTTIDKFITYLNDKKQLDKKQLSDQSVSSIFKVVNASLNTAVTKRIIISNPAKFVEKPQVAKKEMMYWNEEEVQKFLTGFNHRYRIIFFLATYTGMRIGELLGLKMSNIDIDKKKIYVRQILISRNKRLKPGAKTVAGVRSISISDRTVAEIKKHKKIVSAEKLAAKEGEYFDNDLLICTKDGKPLDDSYSRKLFLSFIKKTGVRQIRIHDLRHTFASLLLKASVHPKVVQEMLGHSSIKMTMDKYSHLIPNMQADAAEILDAAINKKETYQNPTKKHI